MTSGKPEGEKGEDKLTASTKRMETILDLALGKPQAAANLVMVPLSGNPAAALSYLLILRKNNYGNRRSRDRMEETKNHVPVSDIQGSRSLSAQRV